MSCLSLFYVDNCTVYTPDLWLILLGPAVDLVGWSGVYITCRTLIIIQKSRRTERDKDIAASDDHRYVNKLISFLVFITPACLSPQQRAMRTILDICCKPRNATQRRLVKMLIRVHRGETDRPTEHSDASHRKPERDPYRWIWSPKRLHWVSCNRGVIRGGIYLTQRQVCM